MIRFVRVLFLASDPCFACFVKEIKLGQVKTKKILEVDHLQLIGNHGVR